MAKIKILDSQIPEHNNSVGWHLLLLLPHCHAQEQPQKSWQTVSWI
jgi:hypothetical protein